MSEALLARNAGTAGPSLRLPNVPDDNFGKDFICHRCRLRGSVIKAKNGRALIRNENARLPFGGCLCRCGRDVLRDAGRLIADIHAGLQCGIDAHSHHARRRRRHLVRYFFVDRSVCEAMNFSPVAPRLWGRSPSQHQLFVDNRTRCRNFCDLRHLAVKRLW